MENLNYTTVEGDRIDMLAHRFYGSNAGIALIADANPAIPMDAVYPLGTVLVIPMVEETQTTDKSDLPPWKR